MNSAIFLSYLRIKSYFKISKCSPLIATTILSKWTYIKSTIGLCHMFLNKYQYIGKHDTTHHLYHTMNINGMSCFVLITIIPVLKMLLYSYHFSHPCVTRISTAMVLKMQDKWVGLWLSLWNDSTICAMSLLWKDRKSKFILFFPEKIRNTG